MKKSEIIDLVEAIENAGYEAQIYKKYVCIYVDNKRDISALNVCINLGKQLGLIGRGIFDDFDVEQKYKNDGTILYFPQAKWRASLNDYKKLMELK